jgi:hypothetical protein
VNANSAISFIARKVNGVSNAFIPANGLIQNCYIAGPPTTASPTTKAIEFDRSGSIPSTQAISTMSVNRCMILANNYGIAMNLNAGGTISQNTICLLQSANSNLGSGISCSACNSSTGWTMEISGNVFGAMTTSNTATGNYGIAAINLGGGPSSGTVTYNVFNNMIAAGNWSFKATANPIAYWDCSEC